MAPKSVDDVAKKEPHEPCSPACSKTSSRHPAKEEPAGNEDDSEVHDGSSSDPELDPIYPLREGYTRKLIRMKYYPPEELDENFDETAWMKEAYGEDVIVVDMHLVPTGWILVDGVFPSN